ncbi:MAG: MSHA biogenesis protein MshJ [Candidatus Endobugula sp.]|jgi:MSHA biogenesis protein MshJ
MVKVINQLPVKYHALVLRERILLIGLACCLLFFLWYVFFGYPAEKNIVKSKDKREQLLTLSEDIISNYDFSKEQKNTERNMAIIDKRMSSVQSKMSVIDDEVTRFNEKTIPIDEIVLLLRDLLKANSQLSLESLKVYPSEIIKNDGGGGGSFEDAFEKSMISITLKGTYSSIFSYLKTVESLDWSIFWENVEYSVDEYPIASVAIQIYTLSVIEGDRYASR